MAVWGILASALVSTKFAQFLAAGGEAARLTQAFDWSSTTLGPIDEWPQHLRAAVSMTLHSHVPIILLWGWEGHMIYNDAFAIFAGHRHPGLIGAKVREGWPEVADFNDNVMKVVLGGGTLAYRDQELTLYRNGVAEQVWMDLDYSPVTDDQGTPHGVVAIVGETTARVNAQAALKQSEEQFRVFAQAMANQVWAANADGELYWFNEQVYRYAGVAPGSLDGATAWAALVHPDDLGVASARWAGALTSGKEYEAEFRMRRHDGVFRWFLARAEPVTEGSGAVVGWVGTNTDINDLRETEQALRIVNETLEEQVAARTAELQAKEARLRAVFETSFGFQGLLDPDGRLLDANATSLAAIGCTLDDIAGLSFWDTPWFTGTPGMPEIIRDAVSKVAGGGVVRQELFINLPAGGWRWFDFVLRPIMSAAGNVVAIVPEALETTERRKAEEALRQSQKLEAMGQLTGGVAHDFNNLLTPIIGTLDLLHRREVGDERERRLIQNGLQSAERAKTLVQRLLAFARRQPLQLQPVNVSAMIANMRQLVASTSGPRIRLEIVMADALPPATAEVNQLEMALLNLAVNARDAMPDGGTLTISADVVDGATAGADLPPGQYVRIGVSDTGIGMDEETRRRAIEPFFSTKGLGKGTGLGLSMVHGLASQLGGALLIDSRPMLGTSINLLLPVAAGTPLAAESIAAPPPPSSIHASGRVLLVDDELAVRAATADMLGELGFEVVEATSAEEALLLHARGPFDLLVTDYMMSGMNGMALIEIVRERTPELPVLVISGYADATGIAPDVARITKPFRAGELAAIIQEVRGG